MDQLSRNDCLNLIKDLCDRSSVNQEAVDAFVRRTIVERNPKGFAKKQKEHKAFDMSKYRQRHLAFHVQYDGSPFYGFAEQNSPGGDVSVEDTVEKHIFGKQKPNPNPVTCPCPYTTICTADVHSVPSHLHVISHHGTPCRHAEEAASDRTQAQLQLQSMWSHRQRCECIRTSGGGARALRHPALCARC